MTRRATTRQEAERCIDTLERQARTKGGSDSVELIEVAEILSELIDRTFERVEGLAAARVVDLTPLEWDRIDARDLQYLGRTLFRAFHERHEHPDRFTILVGLVTGTLLAEAKTK